MDNHVLESMAMFFVGKARRFADTNPPPVAGMRLYMVAFIDGCIPRDSENWPFFWHEKETVRLYFKRLYPSTRHLVEIDLDHKNPRKAWKELTI